MNSNVNSTSWVLRSLVLVLFALSSSAMANDAGCGLGSLIFRENSKLLQLFALTTNGTFSSQIFGITSGTSNCSASGIVMREKAVQYYVEVNHDDLTREMAQGEGEKLNTLAALYGCEGASANGFRAMTQASFGRIVPDDKTGPNEMIKNLNKEFEQSKSLKESCSQKPRAQQANRHSETTGAAAA